MVPPRKAWRLAVTALLALPFLTATPAQAAPIGQGLTITPADLAYILKQIKIAEAHVANTTSETGPCGALLGEGPNQLPSPLLSFGLRTVDGSCNNLIAGQEKFGAADELFPRLGGKNFTPAENAPAGLFGPGSPAFPTTYADKGANNTVVDSQPRVISNLIADQTANNPAAVAAAGYPVRTQAPGDGTPTTDGGTLFIPNVTTDVGLSAPYNSWFTLFGQFFDHGIDQTVKGGGTVIVPLQADDPLIAGPDRIAGNADDPKPGGARYVPPSMRFMALTRAANQPGKDGKLGTADDVQDAKNTDSPLVDLSQAYGSHAAHQVFLREYDDSAASTGRLLAGAAGGLPTWAEVKQQTREKLGLELSDADVLDVPMILTDAYGRFVPGPERGLPQYVTKTGLVEGNTAAPVAVPANVVHFDTPFLTDIAHNADPTPVDSDHNPATPPVAPRPDSDTTASADFAAQPPGTYDDEMLAAHYIAGDGRANENIGLTTVHAVFHAEHNRLVDDIERVLTEDTSATGTAALPEWQLADGAWNGERIFQAARFVDEMEYQHLVFEEFARKIQPAINPFQPFAFTQSELNPAVYAEFAHAVYRFGHSMLTETIQRTREDGSDDSLSLLDGFLNPPAFTNNGTLSPEQAAGEVVTGMTQQVGNELDEFMTDTLRDNLLGLPMDLAAINLARGRSEGVPSLNGLRRVLHAKTNDGQLAPYTSWVDFGEHLKHPESLVNFVAAYGNHPSIRAAGTVAAKRAAARAIVDPQPGDVVPDDAPAFLNATGTWTPATSGLEDVDLWIGGLAEVTNPFGGLLGSTFNYVFENQLTNLQNGDRLYYLARTPGMNLRAQLEGNSFAELIQRTTTAHSLRADVFSTADCSFELSNLAGTAQGYEQFGNLIHDDPASQCDERALLIRMPDGTIQYRARNTVDRSGINAQSVYNGTEDADRVVAGNDNDTVWGNEGDDRIEGGAGNDLTLGGEGDDIMTDLGGDDIPKGGPGNDAIDGGIGLDIVMGGTGKDFTNGGANINETFAGEGDDVVNAGDGEDVVFGDSGDDWQEGGNGPDLLQGDSGNLFFLDDSNKPGNDVLIGQGGDDDYDMEGGDDIGVQGPGIEKNAGASGYDWSIGSTADQGGDDQPMDSDLALPLVALDVLTIGVRDRYNEVEALSGSPHDDTLRGDDLTPSTVGGGGFIGCDALDARGISRIHGLDQIVTQLPTPASAVGNASGRPCDLEGNVWGEGNILLGGAGNDTIEGRGGNDIIDGDRYVNVRLSVRDKDGNEVRSARSMTELQADVFAGRINPADIYTVREIRTSATPDADTAVFSGASSQYAIIQDGDAILVSGPDGTDTLRNVEKLQFGDRTIDLTVPGAVTRVVGIAGDGEATVAFTAPVDSPVLPTTGFTVERTDGVTTVVTELPGTARAFTATDLTNGTAYRFRVRATNAMGTGEFSDFSDAVVPAPPGRRAALGPTNVTATAGDASAVVAWTPPADDGGADITGYEVQAYDLITFDAVGPARAVSAGTEVTMTGLTNGVPYWFRVRAINSVGPGAWSDGSNPITPMVPVTAPAPPAVGRVTGGSGLAVIRWTAPANDGGATITRYEVEVVNAATGARVGAVRRAAADASQLSVTGLANGTAYRFRVRAVNEVGAGAYSATSAAVKPMAVPGMPPSVTAARGASGGPRTVTVRWTAPANGGSPILAYHVTRQQLNARGHAVGAPVTATFSARTFATTFTAPRTVARDTRFRFIVQAVNQIGLGAGRSAVGSVR